MDQLYYIRFEYIVKCSNSLSIYSFNVYIVRNVLQNVHLISSIIYIYVVCAPPPTLGVPDNTIFDSYFFRIARSTRPPWTIRNSFRTRDVLTFWFTTTAFNPNTSVSMNSPTNLWMRVSVRILIACKRVCARARTRDAFSGTHISRHASSVRVDVWARACRAGPADDASRVTSAQRAATVETWIQRTMFMCIHACFIVHTWHVYVIESRVSMGDGGGRERTHTHQARAIACVQ